MSLINQALKQEQKRRSLSLQREDKPFIHTPSGDIEEDTPPPPLPAEHKASPQRKKPNTLTILLGFAGAGAALIACGAAFIYFGQSYLEGLDQENEVAQAETEAQPIAQQEATTESLEVAQPIEGVEAVETVEPVSKLAQVEATLQANENRVDALEQVESESQEAIEAELVAATPQEAATEAEPASIASSPEETLLTEAEPVLEPQVEIVAEVVEPLAPEPDGETQKFIDKLEIHGFRAAGEASRLILNGRLYMVGDIVDHGRKLRFAGSEGRNYAVFVDEAGARYTRPL